MIFVFTVVTNDLTLSSRDTTGAKHSAEQVCHAYRCLQLIMQETAVVLGTSLPLLHAIWGQLAVSTGQGIIIGWQKMDGATITVFLGVQVAVLYWVGFLAIAATLPKASEKCLLSWKTESHRYWGNGKDKKYMMKFRKTCKPLVAECQGHLKIRHETVLRFVQGVTRGVFRILLAVRDSCNVRQ